MEMQDNYDVVIVGYGPVGRLLALKLGRRGHNVLVVERQKATYFLPRAVHLDDEACRILQSVGAGPDRMHAAIGPYDDFYEWRNAKHETILRLDWRGRGPSGWNVSNFFNQPLLEKQLHSLVDGQLSVDIAYGNVVTALVERSNDVEVSVRNAEGTERKVHASYVVGADGARSMVRDWIGGTVTDLGYFHDWLVIDLVMKSDKLVFDPPAWQLCDPVRPTTLVPGGPGRRRFEFMRLPHETPEDLNDETTAWRLLEPWGITPLEATLERHTIYTFQAKWSDCWRRGRVLLAGDAAHLMPPFAGQGMCSGLRDAVNLEWKLSLVLRGLAPDSLLNTYGPERIEHVRHFIEASMALGEVICITDTEAAVDRDRMMRDDLLAGVEQPARPLPRLGLGALDGSPAAGLLSIQTVVQSGAEVGLLDDIVPHDGLLLVQEGAASALTSEQLEVLVQRGVRVASFGVESEGADLVDLDDALARWFAEIGAVAVLVRPDYYLFGSAATVNEVPALADRFLEVCGVGVVA